MTQYDISILPDDVSHEYQVLLRGPGIGDDGKIYVFRSPERCASFIEAVNFAYRQGLRDGRRRRENSRGELFVITGTTPENMRIEREGWLARVQRRVRAIFE